MKKNVFVLLFKGDRIYFGCKKIGDQVDSKKKSRKGWINQVHHRLDLGITALDIKLFLGHLQMTNLNNSVWVFNLKDC